MDVKATPKIQKISFDRILTWTFFLVIITVVIITFLKYFYLKDYIIQAEAECDPMAEECFIYECVPGVDEDCAEDPDDPEAMLSYYKLVEKKAFLVPLCDPNDENCDALNCAGLEEDNCKEILCSDETKDEGIECIDPAAYAESHPEEEEDEGVSEEECDPEGDEECEAAGEESESEECAPDDEECANEEDSVESGTDDSAQEDVSQGDQGASAE